jgi:hypothetical protein
MMKTGSVKGRAEVERVKNQRRLGVPWFICKAVEEKGEVGSKVKVKTKVETKVKSTLMWKDAFALVYMQGC